MLSLKRRMLRDASARVQETEEDNKVNRGCHYAESANPSCSIIINSSSPAKEPGAANDKNLNRPESSIRFLMFLSCWGPN